MAGLIDKQTEDVTTDGAAGAHAQNGAPLAGLPQDGTVAVPDYVSRLSDICYAT